MIAAAALTALDAYRPELTVKAAEEDLTDTQDGVLNIAQTFRAAGLGDVVAAGEAAEPATPSEARAPTPPAGTQPATPPTSTPTRTSTASTFLEPLARPRAKFTRDGKHLALMLQSRPRGIRVEIRSLGYRGHTQRLAVLHTLTSSSITIPLPPGTGEIEARYIDPYDIQRTSEWTTLRAPQLTHASKRRP